MTFTHYVNEASRQNHLDLAVCHPMFGDVRFCFGFVDDVYPVSTVSSVYCSSKNLCRSLNCGPNTFQ